MNPLHAPNAQYRLIAMAAWLTKNIHTIATHPAADEFHDELKQRIHEIDRIINRPTPSRVLGRCPTLLATGNGQSQCTGTLTARRDLTHIQCPQCKTTHEVETLIKERIDDVKHQWFTQNEVLAYLDALGENVPLRTFQHWRKQRRIPSILGTDGTPRYRIEDARTLRREKPQQKPTGRATRNNHTTA